MKNAAKAKKLAIARETTKRLRSSGFKRTMGGYQFPDVDKDAILKAAKLKALAKKLKKEGKKITPPPEPKMGVDAMDPDGAY